MKNVLVLVAFSVLLGACGAAKYKTDGQHKVTVKNKFSIWSLWVKDKKKKYDLELVLHNESSKSQIVKLGDVWCYRGKTKGRIGYSSFGIGERTIDFVPGQQKNLKVSCKTGEAGGDFKVVIKRLFSNPSDDGATPGKVIAKDLTWTFVEPQK